MENKTTSTVDTSDKNSESLVGLRSVNNTTENVSDDSQPKRVDTGDKNTESLVGLSSLENTPESVSEEDCQDSHQLQQTESDCQLGKAEVESIKTKQEIDNNVDLQVDDKYAEHVTYNEEGTAVYTDPTTKSLYIWSSEKFEWVAEGSLLGTDSSAYENEHYKWCSETNQWVPKTKTPTDNKTENEYYQWNEKTNQWEPKLQTSHAVTRLDSGEYTYTDKDGMVFFWDNERNAWFPKIDDDFMAKYQMSYGFIDNTTSNEPAIQPLPEVTEQHEGKESETAAANTAQKRKAQPEWFDLPPEQNTKVYVSNLPLDITEDEFVEVMSKCGLIMRDPQNHKFKIKLYSESNGQLKGDGLCDYIKVESVHLALKILDDSDVRGNKIKVQQAKFQLRGEYDPSRKPKKNKKTKEKIQKMKEKLFDWRPDKMRGERSKHERVVIVKNLFDPELFDKEVHLIIDYQNELSEECKKYGTVRKVVLYDKHPEGIAQVIMGDPEEADQVVEVMNGRLFGKRKLSVEIWDGKTKYKIGETEDEVSKRLSNWDKFLETDENVTTVTEPTLPKPSENLT